MQQGITRKVVIDQGRDGTNLADSPKSDKERWMILMHHANDIPLSDILIQKPVRL